MGCRESKVECPESQMERRKSNVSVFSRLPGETDSPPTEVDPRSPLNVREIYRLKQSWKGIRRNMEQTGVEMFINLFRTNTEILHLFQGFTHIQGDALRENETLEAHAMLVMNTLDKAFTNLEKYDLVVESLMATGATHCRFPGFEDRFFKFMEEPFLNAIKLTLGDRYSERIEKLYKVYIDFILSTLQKGMLQAKEEQINEQKKINENSNHVTTPSSEAQPPAITVKT